MGKTIQIEQKFEKLSFAPFELKSVVSQVNVIFGRQKKNYSSRAKKNKSINRSINKFFI